MAKFRLKQLRLKISEAVSNRLRLRAESNRILAEAVMSRLKMKAVSNRLLAASELLIGAFGKGIGAIDLVAIADAFAVLFGKKPIDIVNSNDSARLSVNKIALDISAAIDQNSLSVSKPFEDTGNLLDLAEITANKVIFDDSNTNDNQTVSFGKSIEDFLASQEIISILSNKSLLDDSVASDLIGKALSKSLSDNVSITDSLSSLLSRLEDFADSSSFQDIAYLIIGKAEDDILQLADDAALIAGKKLFDTSLTNDSASKNFSKSLSDSVLLSDSAIVAKTQDAPLSDSGAIFDEQYLTFGKKPIETISFLDNQSFSITKGLLDTVYATDDIGAEATIDDDQILQVQKRLIDLPSIADLVSRNAGYSRSFSDDSDISDSVLTEAGYQRQFQEAPLFTDSLALLVSYNKAFNDIGSLTDQVSTFAGKVASDIMNSTDSGFVLNQDYVDNNLYFADDYVGLKRIF